MVTRVAGAVAPAVTVVALLLRRPGMGDLVSVSTRRGQHTRLNSECFGKFCAFRCPTAEPSDLSVACPKYPLTVLCECPTLPGMVRETYRKIRPSPWGSEPIAPGADEMTAPAQWRHLPFRPREDIPTVTHQVRRDAPG
ncbi:hypothetical protein GCM10010278_64310 [Streptomyces melanogenes]|nr:hypothetical protein GCM10010278_64310 [Streptomyces melanogenes]